MKCPKCQSQLIVTNSVKAGEEALVQRRECSNTHCAIAVTTVVMFVTIDPDYRNGYWSIARRLKDKIQIVQSNFRELIQAKVRNKS